METELEEELPVDAELVLEVAFVCVLLQRDEQQAERSEDQHRSCWCCLAALDVRTVLALVA